MGGCSTSGAFAGASLRAFGAVLPCDRDADSSAGGSACAAFAAWGIAPRPRDAIAAAATAAIGVGTDCSVPQWTQ